MPQDDLKDTQFERCGKAAMIGCGVVGILAILAAGLVLSFSTGAPYLEKLGSLAEFVLISVVPASTIAAIGAVVRDSGRAVVYGAVVFGVIAGECVWLTTGSSLTWENLWFVGAASAFGGLLGECGAIVARTVREPTEETKPFQFLLRELLLTFFLLAILLGYLVHFALSHR